RRRRRGARGASAASAPARATTTSSTTPERRRSGLELLDSALGRWLVLAPAQQLGPVTDSPGADVVEAHLDDELGSQVDPLELAGAVGRVGLLGDHALGAL